MRKKSFIIIGIIIFIGIIGVFVFKTGLHQRIYADGVMRKYVNGEIDKEIAIDNLVVLRNKDNQNVKNHAQNLINAVVDIEEGIDKIENPDIFISANKHFRAGDQKIELKVDNQSGKDINYIKIDIFEKRNGKIINSDWTNTTKIIKNNSTAYIETYYDFQNSDSELEFEISDVIYN